MQKNIGWLLRNGNGKDITLNDHVLTNQCSLRVVRKSIYELGLLKSSRVEGGYFASRVSAEKPSLSTANATKFVPIMYCAYLS